jgi:DNA-binding winged helix-turn-helix (wHTH) protein
MVALTPKAFAVLRRLGEDGGQLVSKEELLEPGWGKTHVGEGVLKVIILEIRRALEDDPAAPRSTIPNRYGFAAVWASWRQVKQSIGCAHRWGRGVPR